MMLPQQLGMVVVVSFRSSQSARLIYTYTFRVYSQGFFIPPPQIIGTISIWYFYLKRAAPENYRSIL